MLYLGRVSELSIKMQEYSISRMPDAGEYNYARTTAFYRSHGLLEKHSISSAWISMGCFSFTALLPLKKIKSRIFVIMIFLLFLLGSLNFTSIISFITVIIFVEFKGHLLFKGLIAKSSFKKTVIFLLSLTAIFSIFIIMFQEIIIPIQKNIAFQTGLLFGQNKMPGGSSFIGEMISMFFHIPSNMAKFPLAILIGDGFSSWGVVLKGGDYGHIETIYRFGFPMYFVIIIGLIKLTFSALKQLHENHLNLKSDFKFIYFASCFIFYVLIATIHYSIWSVKSTLPIFFFSLAIFSRFLKYNFSKN